MHTTAIDRTQAPKPVNLTGISSSDKIFGLDLIHADPVFLTNNIPVYWTQSGKSDLYKIEILFQAGYLYQKKNLQASFTNNLLKDGTTSHSSEEIAGILDQHGAFLYPDSDKDRAGITLFLRSEHFSLLFPLLGKILREPTFPEEELQHVILQKKQQYLVENQKVGYLATRKFQELIFGFDHPYGKPLELDDFSSISRKDILDFYHTHYRASGCIILIAGPPHSSLLPLLEQELGCIEQGIAVKTPALPPFASVSPEQTFLVLKEDAVQNAIRIGTRTLIPSHPDYTGLKVLNTLLGGFFGSRLMKNIREQKGYTYGIGSTLLSYEKAGAFVIYSDVASSVSSLAIREIMNEITSLSESLADEQELNLVKNYLLGSFLWSIDGTFEVSSRLKNRILFELPADYYSNYITDIQSITSKQLLDLARKYLSPEIMIRLMAGKEAA